jgi:CBS domain-containing protein
VLRGTRRGNAIERGVTMLVRDIMTTAVISISPEHSVRHAAQIMLDRHISGLPVIDDEGRLAGMLTEGDLLRRAELGAAAGWIAEGQSAEDFIRRHSWRVGDVMTPDALTVAETTPIDKVATLMRTHGIRRLPVVRDGVVVGVVSRADLLRSIVAAGRDDSADGDDAIHRAVATRLYQELRLDPAAVVVTVGDGNVHLAGQVASAMELKAALLAAETVQSVRGVTSSLLVG